MKTSISMMRGDRLTGLRWFRGPGKGGCYSKVGATLMFCVNVTLWPFSAIGQNLPDIIDAPVKPQLPDAAKPRSAPPLQPQPVPGRFPELTLPAPGVAAPPGAESTYVVLHKLVVEGSSVYSKDQLKQYYAQFVDTKISLLRLFEIAAEIQARYRADGYLLTRVIVPAQRVSDGVFRLQVIEGFISRVKIEGDIGPVEQRIQDYLSKITNVRPVKEKDLERYLLLANDIAGVQVFGVLQRSEDDIGASELVVRTERKPFDGFFVVNNRGSKYTGPWRAGLTIRENASTAFGEGINLLLFAAENNEQKFGQLSYEQLLGTDGLKLGILANYGPAEPRYDLSPLDVETTSGLGRISLTYPWLRTRKQSFYLSGGFDAVNQRVDVLGKRFTRDDLRLIYLDAAYEFDDRFGGINTVGGGLRQGLDVLGASEEGDPDLSRPDGNPTATSVNLRGSRYQPLVNKLGLYLRGAGQYAFDALLSDEEFRVGGESFGRGYDPSEIAGDSGLGVSAELQYTDIRQLGPIQSYQTYGFYDFGAVWNRHDAPYDHASLESAGVGVRTQMLNVLFLDLELAWPLTRAPATNQDKDPQLYFQLSARF